MAGEALARRRAKLLTGVVGWAFWDARGGDAGLSGIAHGGHGCGAGKWPKSPVARGRRPDVCG